MAMDARGSFERDVTEKFGIPSPTRLSEVGRSPAIGFSRIRGQPTGQITKISRPEDAYAISIFLHRCPEAQLQINGRDLPARAFGVGALVLTHLESCPAVRLHAPIDVVRFYMSRETLDEVAESSGAVKPGGLSRPEFGASDPILHHIALATAALIESNDASDQLLLDQIALATCSRLTAAYSGIPRDAARDSQGVLSPWQEKRAKAFIEANLGQAPRLAEIAAQCKLSASHFARAFRQTTGRPPHRWLLERRIEAAKAMLSSEERQVSDIAYALGFSDASHFSRMFSALSGQTPSAWRRGRHLIK